MFHFPHFRSGKCLRQRHHNPSVPWSSAHYSHRPRGLGWQMRLEVSDQEEGREAAPNEIRHGDMKDYEMKFFGSFSHPGVLRLFHVWIDPAHLLLIFITNGTIRSSINEVVHTLPRSVISNWCWQILVAFARNGRDPARSEMR